MKESDKQTRQSVRAENRRLGLDVLHQPPQALKSDYHRPTKTPTPAIISERDVTFCEVKIGKRRRNSIERERWRGGGERDVEAEEQRRVGSRGGKQKPAYLMKQADEPN